MKAQLELRIATEENSIVKNVLGSAISGLIIEDQGAELLIKLEESGRLLKNSHILVSYINYVLKTINELNQLEEKTKTDKKSKKV